MYTDGMLIEKLATHFVMGTAGNFFFTPAFMPVRVRAIAVAVDVAVDTANEVYTITKRIVTGSDAGALAVATLTAALATGAAGKVFYKKGLNTILLPGQELKVAHDGGSTNFSGTVEVMFEPAWEEVGNIAAMIASA